MDIDQNYFADSTEIGLTSPTSSTFGTSTASMPPWYQAEAMYNSPEAFAEDPDDYSGGGTTQGGTAYSWSSTDAATTSPLTSISSFSTAAAACISPTAVQDASSFIQWPATTVGDWTPSFDRNDLALESSSTTTSPLPPPPKKQKHKPTTTTTTLSSSSHHRRTGSKPSKPRAAAEPPPSPPTTPPDQRTSQLRTASRKAKRTSAHKPAASEEERRARASHNLVEKQYRNRLNAQFERLLAVLPPPGDGDGDGGGVGAGGGGEGDDRRLSKAEVLDIARRRIKALERERDSLREQNDELCVNMGKMREAIVRQRREG